MQTDVTTRPKTTPRALISGVIQSLETRFGEEVQGECLRLLQADELLARTERALFARPESEWPQVITKHRRPKRAIMQPAPAKAA